MVVDLDLGDRNCLIFINRVQDRIRDNIDSQKLVLCHNCPITRNPHKAVRISIVIVSARCHRRAGIAEVKYPELVHRSQIQVSLIDTKIIHAFGYIQMVQLIGGLGIADVQYPYTGYRGGIGQIVANFSLISNNEFL